MLAMPLTPDRRRDVAALWALSCCASIWRLLKRSISDFFQRLSEGQLRRAARMADLPLLEKRLVTDYLRVTDEEAVDTTRMLAQEPPLGRPR
jgi:hypothetical protein